MLVEDNPLTKLLPVLFLLTTENLGATPALLNSKLTWVLPHVILEAEEDGVGANLLHDALNSDRLSLSTRRSLAVGLTRMWPPRFKVVDFLARANLAENLDLASSEGTGIRGRDF